MSSSECFEPFNEFTSNSSKCFAAVQFSVV